LPISEDYVLIEKKTGASLDSYGAVFRLSFRVDDIVEKYTIKSPDGVNLLVMGSVKGAGEGCVCPANALVRSLLRHIIVKRNEAVIVDMEAGVEHLGRGTAEHVDCMLIVTEPTVKSIDVAKKIYDLAIKLKIPDIFLVGNKITTEKDEEILSTINRDKKILLFIPFDERIRDADAFGNWRIDIDEPSPGISKIQELLEILIEKSMR
jgi:CO dehydrogenase maturation factor